MHPLIARIHPAFRIALLAWLVSRAALWLIGGPTLGPVANGAPLPGMMAALVDHAAASAPSSSMTWAVTLLPWIMAELLFLGAGVAVYRFARTTDLPQIAERACWLWFFNPLLAMGPLDWGTQVALAAGAMAVAGVVTHRPRWAALCAVIALGCRLEFALLWPALAAAGWHQWRRNGRPAPTFWLPALVIPTAFSMWIGAAWHLAGTLDTSLRALHGPLSWRSVSDFSPAFPGEWILLPLLALGLALALRYSRRLPRWYPLAACPLLIWPLVQSPAPLAAIVLAWSLPSFVHLSLVTDDRSMERPVLAALIVAFCAIAAL